MKVLGFDPGAKRQGYAIIENLDKPRLIASGVLGVERGKKEKYQEYRMRVIDFWASESQYLIRTFRPDHVVSEIIPVASSGNFIVAAQSQLASAAITTVQSISLLSGLTLDRVTQIGASTIKSTIGGKARATKVQVREGIIARIPDLASRRKQWTTIFDESDAIAVALTLMDQEKEKDERKAD